MHADARTGGRDQHAAKRRRRMAVACTAAVSLAFSPAARALDLDGTEGLITETIASRERLKDYDNIKKYTAPSASTTAIATTPCRTASARATSSCSPRSAQP